MYNLVYFVTTDNGPIAFIFIVCFLLLGLIFSAIPTYLIRFSSIKDEVQYSQEGHKFEGEHLIIKMLGETQRDYFVLAYFEKTKEIEPSVYTHRGKYVTIINLRVKYKYYKNIYFDENKNVRVRRVMNKTTKTQMICFASDMDDLVIYIKNTPIPKIEGQGRVKNFSVYGIIETPETVNCDTVNINGFNYKLIEDKDYKSFINRNEV